MKKVAVLLLAAGLVFGAAHKGAQAGLISSTLFPPIVLMVIVTTLITPILLKIFMDPGHEDRQSPEIQGPN